MTPNKEMGCLGMEYFCNENDSFWKMNDSQLKEIAIKEITELKLSNSTEIFDAFVVRQKKAYPVYDSNYNQIIQFINEISTDSIPFLPRFLDPNSRGLTAGSKDLGSERYSWIPRIS
jgi:protoporphyrinogen oxidase